MRWSSPYFARLANPLAQAPMAARPSTRPPVAPDDARPAAPERPTASRPMTPAETDAPFVARRIEATSFPPSPAAEVRPAPGPSRLPGQPPIVPAIATPDLKPSPAPELVEATRTPHRAAVASETADVPVAKAGHLTTPDPREQQAAALAPLPAPAAAVAALSSILRDIDAGSPVASPLAPAAAAKASPASAPSAPPLLQPSLPAPEPASTAAPRTEAIVPRTEPVVHIGAIEVRVSPPPQPPAPAPMAPSWSAPSRPPLPAPGYGWRYGRAQS